MFEMHDEIDPEIIRARRLRAAVYGTLDVTSLPTAEARALANKSAMVFNDGKPELRRVEEFEVPGPGGSIRARLYQPAGARSDATIFYIHGGGWFACDVDTHDRMLRFLAHESGLSVLAFDFRLSPEFPYPAALDDSRAVWAWLHSKGSSLGIPTEKVAAGGDSAGGNLALALAIDQRDQGGPTPVGLALLYGCFAPGLMTESRERYGAPRFGLTGERMDWYWANYLGAAADNLPPLAAPLYANLAGLPPVYLGIAECDVVSDDSRLLAARLAEVNVPAELDMWRRGQHGMLQMTRDVQIARDAVTSIAGAIVGFVS
jgi:acetyl esterase